MTMCTMPLDRAPYKVRHTQVTDVMDQIKWCHTHVGERGVDWDLVTSTYLTFGYWLFDRESHAVAFTIAWL